MDWVELGAYLTIAVSFIIPVVLVIKAYKLIYKDDGKK